jgi:hypothetical protein
MIKFFRRIRQNLLIEGKATKYFKYAIGEIALVVIGILIALQINDWNEVRKNQNYEQEILILINQNLKNDSIALSNQLSHSKESTKSTNRLLEQVSLGNYSDSLNNWMGKIISFESFKTDWAPILKEDFLDYKWRELAIPTDSKAFFEKQSTISFIKLYRENRSSGEGYLEAALEKISKISSLSKAHIND